tara:strand:+ start:226 stop:411 length:186 start_codon:yes stop_codon:yes gene_type:complete
MHRPLSITVNMLLKKNDVKDTASLPEEALETGPDCLITRIPITERPKPLELIQRILIDIEL